MSVFRNVNVNNKTPDLIEAGIWGDIRFDASDTAPTYIGLNLSNPASITSSDWKIYKFTYSSGAVTRVQLNYGAWSNRASLSW